MTSTVTYTDGSSAVFTGVTSCTVEDGVLKIVWVNSSGQEVTTLIQWSLVKQVETV